MQPALLDPCITVLPLGRYRPARNQSTLIPTPAWSIVFQLLLSVTDLATRPKGIARDIKSDIRAVANTYQPKVSAAIVDRWEAGSSTSVVPV